MGLCYHWHRNGFMLSLAQKWVYAIESTGRAVENVEQDQTANMCKIIVLNPFPHDKC